MIYVVDDDQSVAQLISAILNAAGHKTTVFMNPVIALETFESADPKPELMITDCGMPQMNGLELVQRCKTLSPELKVFMLTGTLTPNDLDRLTNHKPDILLQKPVPPALIREVVKALLNSDQMGADLPPDGE